MFLIESPAYRANEKPCQMGAEGKGHSVGKLQNSTEVKKVKPRKTRYFIIKSLNHQNLQLSIKKGIWATQVMNEPILEEAFHVRTLILYLDIFMNILSIVTVHRHILILQSSGKVILIFSVNASGFFQGYAQMMSTFGWRRDNLWSQGTGGNNPWGRSFKVKWLQLNDLPFAKTLHLKNPLNDNKPVKISRDCQVLVIDNSYILLHA